MLEASHAEQMLILCMAGPFHTQGTEKLKLFIILISLNTVFHDKQMNNGPKVIDVTKLFHTYYLLPQRMQSPCPRVCPGFLEFPRYEEARWRTI